MDENALRELGLGSNDSEINELLFSENWLLFRREVQSAKRYAEWGSGLSTFYAANQDSVVKVVTVETDPLWASRMLENRCNSSNKIEVKHVDLGPVGRWGRPESYSKIHKVKNYSEAPFTGGFSPDLVLVDGRFRVHCFLKALLKSKRGTVIIFDDYVDRPWYHIVEEFILPTEISGRQALFEVKTKLIDHWKIRKLSNRFMYVMD